MRNLLLSCLLTPVIATAAPARIAPPVERVEQTSTYFVMPAVGEIARAEVGASLYTDGIRTVSKRFEAALKSDAESKMDRGYVLSVKSGAQGKMMMRSSYKTPMLCFRAKNTGFIGAFGDRNVNGCLVDTDGDQLFDRSTFPEYDRLFNLTAPVAYDVTTSETTASSRGEFYTDFLYQGMSKGEVKISYREFSNGMARPAFDQDVSYELDPDGTGIIGFKGMRIKVLKATGHELTYVLEQPMPRAVPTDAPAGSAPTPKPWYQ